MNYLQYKNKFPKTLSKYFEWIAMGNEISLYVFFNYLGFEENIFCGDGYFHVITINNPNYVTILKSKINITTNNNTYRIEENKISIETNETMDGVLNCIEILIIEKAL